MPGIDDKNDTEEEEMDQDTPESDKSDEDDSDIGSESEADDSSGKLIYYRSWDMSASDTVSYSSRLIIRPTATSPLKQNLPE